MDNLAPLHSQISTLWAPNVIYEAGNPRQRQPLPLYDTTSRQRKTAQEKRKDEVTHARYAARRDLVNMLRGTTTRMVWDYQAEATTLSDEEQEYEAQLESIRTHGFSWLVPEGKQMNQEAEADDDAINEEARMTAAAASAQAQRDANASNVTMAGEATEADANATTSRRRGSRRPRQRSRRRSGTSGDARDTRTRPRSSGASTSTRGLHYNQLPPRASTGRYSMSSSNGGGPSSVPIPRYGGASTSSFMSRTGRNSNEMANYNGEDGEHDLDADIPDANDDPYGHDEDQDPADAVQTLDEDDDIFTDPGDGSETDDYGSDGRGRGHSSYEPATPPVSEGEEPNENRENEDLTDMDVSS